ncbi:dihydropteroate synthase [Paenibacillus thalictri]|uniref:Dihydropteroate synthase n=1 Tax=Paenibacillus thalictri TaxID=2527873 RepID=A0A4Q9DFE8_9BACL|nr:dihydropteroate synthase [Paenibacillus thalictri]TBL69045.1 dihydropteroate synthase [Paenibacillus thalictri]
MKSELEQQFAIDARGLRLPVGERTLIMGILNVTPDSFSDGGRYERVEAAVARARQMVEEGADIIDLGGESTRPGFEPVPLEVELARVIPVIEALRGEVKVPISVDTYKAEVARQAVEAGAHIINDIWGLKKDKDMAAVAADTGCPIVLMHNRVEPAHYADFVAEVVSDLEASVRLAHEAGIHDRQIILDPGIGFAKSHEQNLQLMSHLGAIAALGYPVLLGTSRKRMVRLTLELPVGELAFGTAATVALGIMQGCGIMRVHDVAEMKRAALMTDAIMKAK